MNKAVLALLFTLALFSTQSQAWTINANFEAGSPGDKAQGSSGFGGAFSNSIYTNKVVHSGTKAAQLSIASGSQGWGEWGGTFSFPAKLKEGNELWFRVYAYFPSGFNFKTTGAALKMMRTHTASSGGKNEGYIDLLLSNSGHSIVVGSEVISDWYNNNADWKSLGGPVTTGKWHAFETYVKFSSKPGQGITRVWQNGKLIKEDKKTATLRSSSSVSDFIYLFTYWNGGSPKAQTAYVDDIAITTSRPENRDANGNAFVGLGKTNSAATPPPAENTPPLAPELSVRR